MPYYIKGQRFASVQEVQEAFQRYGGTISVLLSTPEVAVVEATIDNSTVRQASVRQDLDKGPWRYPPHLVKDILRRRTIRAAIDAVAPYVSIELEGTIDGQMP